MTPAYRYYEDLVVGERHESAPRTLATEELLDFAARYDPQYFHADPAAAAQSSFGEIIASGIYSAAIWRILDHQISGDIRWICGVAWEEVRWPNPLHAGDTVRARSETLSKRRSRSEPHRGIVECRYTLLNQRDQIVFTCRSVNLIEVRPSPE